MRTPAGKECSHFYGDYYRGRQIERCRLMEAHDLNWSPEMCLRCPVPDILQANACEHQSLEPHVHRPLFFMKPQVRVDAYCTKCECVVQEPRVGCSLCHPVTQVFVVAPDAPEDSTR